jgi:hypothetical protein
VCLRYCTRNCSAAAQNDATVHQYHQNLFCCDPEMSSMLAGVILQESNPNFGDRLPPVVLPHLQAGDDLFRI